MNGTVKKICTMLICLCMAVGLFPSAAFATGEAHTHSWESGWTANDTHHWHACAADGCAIAAESECSGYAAHDFSQYPYRCIVCGFSSAHEHYGGNATCEYEAICEGCGTIYGSKDPENHQIPEGFGEKLDDSAHKIMCSCRYVFIASEPHNFTPWSRNNDGTEARWCEDCLYAQTRGSQHTHSYAKATCTAPATCNCGSTSGEKDPSNHTGGTQIKNAVEATYDQEGYTGDTYCSGCGAKIASGETISKLKAVAVKIDEDAGVEDVTFQPAQWVVLPEDAFVSVKQQETGLDPVISLFESESTIRDCHFGASAVRDALYTHADGTQYRSGEMILIDGNKYCIGEYDEDGSVLPVISLSDGMLRRYNMTDLQFEDTAGLQTQLRQTEGDRVRIDGVLYDVPFSYTEADGSRREVLYREGKPAGMINEGVVWLYSDQTPDSMSAADSRYLGTVAPDREQDSLGLSLDTKYDVYLVGANDIQLLSGAGDPLWIRADDSRELGTVTQTFDLETLGLTSVLFTSVQTHYVALHFTEDGLTDPNMMDMDIGQISLSSDGKQLGVTFAAYHFSPFVVYAFTQAREPELKVITSVAPDAPDTPDTSAPSDVGGAEDPDVKASDDNTMWIWLGAAVALLIAGTVAVLLLLKKRNNRI